MWSIFSLQTFTVVFYTERGLSILTKNSILMKNPEGYFSQSRSHNIMTIITLRQTTHVAQALMSMAITSSFMTYK